MPIVEDGLLGYWNSKQGANAQTWEDLSGNGYHGSMIGTLPVEEKGVYFDGLSHVLLPTLPINGNDFTFEARVNKFSDTTNRFIAGISTTINERFQVNGSTPGFQFVAGGRVLSTSDPRFSPATDLQIAFTMKAGEWALYIGGDLVRGGVDFAPFSLSAAPSMFGKCGANVNNLWKGHISLIRYYSRALSPEEVLQNSLVAGEIGLITEIPAAPVNLKGEAVRSVSIQGKADLHRSLFGEAKREIHLKGELP